MASNRTRVVGLGNALVDVLAAVDADAVARHNLTPGAMHLVDRAAADALYAEVGPGVMQSGGRYGAHTEQFPYLIGEMQVLARAHPGASW